MPITLRRSKTSRFRRWFIALAVDPATHRVYAPEQEEDGKPVARMVIYEAANGTR